MHLTSKTSSEISASPTNVIQRPVHKLLLSHLHCAKLLDNARPVAAAEEDIARLAAEPRLQHQWGRHHRFNASDIPVGKSC